MRKFNRFAALANSSRSSSKSSGFFYDKFNNIPSISFNKINCYMRLIKIIL